MFLSRAVAVRALDRGHEVTCASRGRSGVPPQGAESVVVDRDEPAGLAPLAGRAFDAVVDVESLSVTRVRRALAALGPQAAHWTFVSTCSVYADNAVPGQRAVDAPTLEPAAEGSDETDREHYGPLKVACEEAVRAAVGDRAFVCRPGLIVGPSDRSDRFGYWPARLARGGEALAPGDPQDVVQYVDVRDCAAWIVNAAESGLVGTYDAICPPQPWGEVLAGIARAVDAEVTLRWVPQEVLIDRGVNPWGGPDSLPLWLPLPDYAGFLSRDVTDSLAAGLRIRPLADTARASLQTEQELGLDRERRAGLTPAREAAVLAGSADRAPGHAGDDISG